MNQVLLSWLRRRINHLGLTLALEGDLLAELRLPRATLRASLEELRAAGEIVVLSPLPFLVVRARSWSGAPAAGGRNRPQISSKAADPHREVPVSSSAAAAAKQAREVGGAGEGEALLERVLAILGREARREVFAHIVAAHPAALIRRCLQRVQETKHIRVSKAALFRSLLRQLNR